MFMTRFPALPLPLILSFVLERKQNKVLARYEKRGKIVWMNHLHQVVAANSLAGLAWGFFSGRYEADKKGLTGSGKASYVGSLGTKVKSVGKYSLHWGFFAGLFSATHCGIQRYRMEKDWVNSCIAGAVTGAALAARTRSWVQVFGTAAMVSVITTAADCAMAV